MEEQSKSNSQNQAKYLETELTKKLQQVVVELSDINEQCIYKVPEKFRQGNPKAYIPQVVSIGPFHRQCESNGENNNSKKMEELKLEYLQRFLDRNKQITMKDLFQELIEKEKRIRSCYAEPVNCNSNDFLTMILVDACFIIEHFLRFYTGLASIERDPLSKSWLANDVIHDLTLLENQLPFFVLEDIFNSAKTGMEVEFPFKNVKYMDEFTGPVTDFDSLSFLGITFQYFRKYNYMNINENAIESPKHFTDLLRTFMQPSKICHENLKGGYMVKHLPSASQLSEVGLIFKASSNKCLFDFKYHRLRGVMEMPCLTIDDRTEIRLRNILALEQCHYVLSPNITQYLFFLYFLIKTEKDVNILIDKKIIVNWMSDAGAVAKMFNYLCSNVIVSYISEEYCLLYDDLIKFHENPRNKYKAIFYHEYFNTPWKKASTTAAVLLLLLTLIQAICSVISVF
ncbi:hypothetical protein LR48_Vigan10g129900 [Vigna angularis]|uniref:UPF0481 protein n=2 Tax=Phaseolus angularis TaxID=3914 RepID=A0A0L9VKF9_PHAAN|nr:UPF0481 protein At3g47200 [Vigna angularis]XP_052722644.1 UPF0481 protein At3g47200 [Vigna angularis]XP_052722645.1 UPF0481 protein At3g47200 [Vigna angularis]BAU02060.1 hypothetical protein VIGAN_11147700 [Vigna angularis var. angularis]KAG2384620.1 UPF0481 protein [Vigna angularis]KOM55407.1 hypothetical protein LR48_Vigan10g129900 [Vigna angularis]